jgi:hypothetical protein
MELHTVISGEKFNSYKLTTYKFVDYKKNIYFRHNLEYKIDEITLDHLEFNTNKCSAGGMYFFEESHIKEFDEDYGTIICKVAIPNSAQVFIEDKKFKTDRIILSNPIHFKDFCANKITIPDNLVNYYFQKNIYFGNNDKVQLLLRNPILDPCDNDNYAIIMACTNDNYYLVKLLLQDLRVDPSADNNCVIRWASRMGHYDLVELLLRDPRVDPCADKHYAVRWASLMGHDRIAKLLLLDYRVYNSPYKIIRLLKTKYLT